jgi:hypothetical protein
MDLVLDHNKSGNMDPQTRRESKKDQKEKGKGKNGKYTQKHVRKVEDLKKSRVG